MPTDQNLQERRRHVHRGRRGPDRRGSDRRVPPPQAQESAGRDGVDVEQIMREIRSRIAQRHGIELSNEQIQELAARRLEAILDPRVVSPSLIEQLRRSAAAPPELPDTAPDPGYTFDEASLFDSPHGLLRSLRRLLKPVLKLFINPSVLSRALESQAQLNRGFLAREAERERRQTEWNALHYQILQRLVTEVSRVSIEMQSLSMRVESLAAKVDFNERRVRGLESAPSQARSAPRAIEPIVAVGPVAIAGGGSIETPGTETVAATDGTRRKRRRRRGRRGGAGEGVANAPDATSPDAEALDIDDPSEPLDTDEMALARSDAAGIDAESPQESRHANPPETFREGDPLVRDVSPAPATERRGDASEERWTAAPEEPREPAPEKRPGAAPEEGREAAPEERRGAAPEPGVGPPEEKSSPAASAPGDPWRQMPSAGHARQSTSLPDEPASSEPGDRDATDRQDR